MQIKINSKIGFEHILLMFILILSFLSSIFNALYWQNTLVTLWNYLFSISLLSICFIDIVLIGLYIYQFRHMDLLSILVLLYVVYELVINSFVGVYSFWSVVYNGCTWPLSFVAVFLHSKKRGFPLFFRPVLIVFLPVLMLILIKNLQMHLATYAYGGGAIGPTYYCISYLGLVLLLCKKKEKIIFSILIAAMIFLSTKRAGIIIVIIALGEFYLINAKIQELRSERFRKRMQLLLLGFTVLFVVVWYFNTRNSTLLERFSRLSVDEGSGRLVIWRQVFESFGSSSLLKKIFGHGFYAVPVELMPLGRAILAHNSFIEVLYDYGIVGLVWMIGLLIAFYRYSYLLVKRKNWMAPVLMYATVCTLLFPTIAGYFYDESRFVLPIAILCAVIIGEYEREKANMTNCLSI